MCDSIYQSTLQALYGTLFFENKEAAFSNRNLWKSLGSVLGIFEAKRLWLKLSCSAYGYGHHLPVYTKTVIMLAFLLVGFPCYIFVEIIERKRQTEKSSNCQ